MVGILISWTQTPFHYRKRPHERMHLFPLTITSSFRRSQFLASEKPNIIHQPGDLGTDYLRPLSLGFLWSKMGLIIPGKADIRTDWDNAHTMGWLRALYRQEALLLLLLLLSDISWRDDEDGGGGDESFRYWVFAAFWSLWRGLLIVRFHVGIKTEAGRT